MLVLGSAFFLLLSCQKSASSDAFGSRIDSGWQNYRLGEFDLAVQDFQKASQMAENTEAKIQALFGEASCWHYRREKRDTTLSDTLYSQIIQKSPTHSLAVWSELAKVRIRHFGVIEPKPDYVALARDYGDIYLRHPEHLAGQEAFVNKYYVLLVDLPQNPDLARRSIPELQDFLTRYPASPFKNTVCSHLASCYTALKDTRQGLYWMLQDLEAKELDLNNPNADSSGYYWNIARYAEFEAGDFKTAREYYGRLIAEYPKDQRIFESKTALRRMNEVEERIRKGLEPWANEREKGL